MAEIEDAIREFIKSVSKKYINMPIGFRFMKSLDQYIIWYLYPKCLEDDKFGNFVGEKIEEVFYNRDIYDFGIFPILTIRRWKN